MNRQFGGTVVSGVLVVGRKDAQKSQRTGFCEFCASLRPIRIHRLDRRDCVSPNSLWMLPQEALDVAERRQGLPVPQAPAADTTKPSLIIFPEFVPDSDIRLMPVTAAIAGLRLLEGNLNAKNLPTGGLPYISRITKNIPAVAMSYGHSSQLEGVLEPFIQTRRFTN